MVAGAGEDLVEKRQKTMAVLPPENERCGDQGLHFLSHPRTWGKSESRLMQGRWPWACVSRVWREGKHLSLSRLL